MKIWLFDLWSRTALRKSNALTRRTAPTFRESTPDDERNSAVGVLNVFKRMELLMMIKVLAFARYKEMLGFGEAEMPLPDPPRLSELLKQPCFAALPENALLAVNQQFANGGQELRPGDEVAIMPPVSGG